MWIGQAISEVGSSISALAFPLLALAITGSSVNAGLVATVGFLASLLGQIPSGHLADVLDKRKLLIASDLVRAGCLFAVTVMAATGWYRNEAMMALTALNSIAFALTGPSRVSALRTIVSDEELVEAAALMQGRGYAIQLLAPTVGGLLFAAGRALPFVTDGVSFLVSARFTARIEASLAPSSGAARPGFAMSFARGWNTVWTTRTLRWLALFSTSTNFTVSVLMYLVLLGNGASPEAARALGITLTVAGIAGLIGSAAAPWVQRRLALHQVIIASCLVRTLAVVPAILVDGLLTKSVAMIVVVFTSPIARAAFITTQMMIVPREILGTVTGATGLLATCAQPLAPVLAGVLLQFTTSTMTFAGLGAAFVLMAVGVSLPPSLRVRLA
jgi:MFS family permease